MSSLDPPSPSHISSIVIPIFCFAQQSFVTIVTSLSGLIEFRHVVIGDKVKLGVRSVLLGGSTVADGCEVLAKSALDFYTVTSSNQIIGGSPAAVVVGKHSTSSAWRQKHGPCFLALQLLAVLSILLLMALIAFAGVSIGKEIVMLCVS